MITIRTVAGMQRRSRALRCRGRIGLVPTMGYLHEGHLELVRVCRRHADFVVVSLFVNPTQFGPNEDYERYPRDLARDRRLLREVGVDVLFCPTVRDVYPAGYATFVEVERLTQGLCGRFRPGHFRGVTTIVAKLFNIVQPDVAVFGQKDAQQAFVIRRMVRDLGYNLRLVIVPTVREMDGLAMSSRNTYLTPGQRAEAPVLYQSLLLARKMVRGGVEQAGRIKAAMRRLIERRSSGQIDYI
ncbi:MAG: pantoate--beta-alanine ligase, partial [candidate division WOR-3 bacterium]